MELGNGAVVETLETPAHVMACNRIAAALIPILQEFGIAANIPPVQSGPPEHMIATLGRSLGACADFTETLRAVVEAKPHTVAEILERMDAAVQPEPEPEAPDEDDD